MDFLGWIVAAYLGGILSGVVWLSRHAAPGVGVFGSAAPAAPKEPPVQVSEPMEPEEFAQALINDAVKERMIEDFMETHGVSHTDAVAAVEELMEKVAKIGGEATW